MTDINELIGPEPIPTPAPKFPTPWTAIRSIGTYSDSGIKAANGVVVTQVTEYNHPELTTSEIYDLTEFIAEAVNEKIARDQATSPAPEVQYFVHRISDPMYYRVRGDQVEFWCNSYWKESGDFETAEELKTLGNVDPITPSDLPPAARP